jgi:hypothetical protein
VEDLKGKLGAPFGALPFAPAELSNKLSKKPASMRNESSGCWTRNPAERQLAHDSRRLAEGSTPEHPTRVDVSAREPVGTWPTGTDVETALAVALTRAAEAGRWDIVAQLARELEARRLAQADNVVRLKAMRKGGA